MDAIQSTQIDCRFQKGSGCASDSFRLILRETHTGRSIHRAKFFKDRIPQGEAFHSACVGRGRIREDNHRRGPFVRYSIAHS